jgi:hypothetical protein
MSENINGQWSEAKRLDWPFNDEHYNSLEYVSVDGNMFIIKGLYDGKTYISYQGLSLITKREDGGFNDPVPITISDYKNEWEYYSFTFSQDRSVLIMSVIRPDDCFGGSDLYVSFLQEDGTYSTPQNLGPDVNNHITREHRFWLLTVLRYILVRQDIRGMGAEIFMLRADLMILGVIGLNRRI